MVLDFWSSGEALRAPSGAGARAPLVRYAKPSVEEIEPRLVPSGTWSMLSNAAPGAVGTMILLSNGTIMAQLNDGSNQWALLSPDSSGGYANGTWSTIASMDENRLYYASNVLPDGRVFLIGGEYSGPALNQNFDNTGEIYDPVANTWTPIAPFPQAQFGDDPSEVLDNGQVLLGYIGGPQTYLYNPATNSYTATGTKLRNDESDEEGFAKLPDGSILDYEIFSSNAGGVPGHAQRYVPSTGTWVDAGSVPVALSNSSEVELGPVLRLPDGRYFQLGANNGSNAFYNPTTNTWTTGPATPNDLVADDAPAAILPNGDLIFDVDTAQYTPPAVLYDFDYTTNTISAVPVPAALSADLAAVPGAYVTRMIVTPSGQMLLSTDTNQLWLYSPNGGPQDAWRPVIRSITPNGNGTYTLTGQQLNGISEGSFYGDDVENSTNYPIVRITDSKGHVVYARSYGWTSTDVATGNASVSTQFVLPSGLAQGPLVVVVIANGIPSQPFVLNGLKVYYPLRYLYNPADQTYRGNLTIQNVASVPLSGTYLVVPQLPPGVKLLDANATSPSGGPAFQVSFTLPSKGTLRIPIVLLNPLRQPLSTFFIGFPVTLIQEG